MAGPAGGRPGTHPEPPAVVWKFEAVTVTDAGYEVWIVGLDLTGQPQPLTTRVVGVDLNGGERLSELLSTLRLADAEGMLVYLPGPPDAQAALGDLLRRSRLIPAYAKPRLARLRSEGADAWIEVSQLEGASYANISRPGLTFPVTLSIRAELEGGEVFTVPPATVTAMSIALAEVIARRGLKRWSGGHPVRHAREPWTFPFGGGQMATVYRRYESGGWALDIEGARSARSGALPSGRVVLRIGLLAPDGGKLRMEHRDARRLVSVFLNAGSPRQAKGGRTIELGP